MTDDRKYSSKTRHLANFLAEWKFLSKTDQAKPEFASPYVLIQLGALIFFSKSWSVTASKYYKERTSEQAMGPVLSYVIFIS